MIVSRNLVEALEQREGISIQRTRIVLVSSFGVYGVVPLGRSACISKTTPLEAHPVLRYNYSLSKLWKELLLWEYERKNGFELIVLLPG